jgi:hypothetical protein
VLKPKITRGRAEEQRIKRADLSVLSESTKESPDPLNHRRIIDRVAAQIDVALLLILDELVTLQAITCGRVSPEAVIHLDGRRGYDGLVDIGYA